MSQWNGSHMDCAPSVASTLAKTNPALTGAMLHTVQTETLPASTALPSCSVPLPGSASPDSAFGAPVEAEVQATKPKQAHTPVQRRRRFCCVPHILFQKTVVNPAAWQKSHETCPLLQRDPGRPLASWRRGSHTAVRCQPLPSP